MFQPSLGERALDRRDSISGTEKISTLDIDSSKTCLGWCPN
jgi:hypothetical protein